MLQHFLPSNIYGERYNTCVITLISIKYEDDKEISSEDK